MLNTAVHSFDARGVAKRFRHAAIFGALDSLMPGETMRFCNDHDPLPLLAQLQQGRGRAELAADFHATVAAATEAVVRRLARQCGVRTVALSGGVFQNMTLLRQLVERLQGDFTVLVNRQVPANDGGTSLGQAAVARERGW